MARVRSLGGHRIAQHSSPHTGGRLGQVQGVVLHIADGYYFGTVDWQLRQESRVSSHWIVGRQPGQWAQMVDSDTVAWTQGAGNSRWLSIEFAGFAKGHRLNPGGWEKLTSWQVEAAAHLLVWAHQRYKFPLQRANTPSGLGLGYHAMGGVAWGGHPQCPGSDIIAARDTILQQAKSILKGGSGMSWNTRIKRQDWVTQRWPHLGKDAPADTTLSAVYGFARKGAEGIDEVLAGQAAILARIGGGDDSVTQQLIRSELDRHRTLVGEQLDELLEGLPEAIADRLTEVPPEQVRAAVEDVISRLKVHVDPET